MGGTIDIEEQVCAISTPERAAVLDLDAFRARRAAEPLEPGVVEGRAQLCIVGDEIALNLDEISTVVILSAGHAEGLAEALTELARRIRVRQERRQREQKRDRAPTASRDGRKLPLLKLRGWAIDTLGGSPGSTDPRWVRMSRPASRLEAEGARREYIANGYAADRVRVVPVDHRGRVIPPERMPTEAR